MKVWLLVMILTMVMNDGSRVEYDIEYEFPQKYVTKEECDNSDITKNAGGFLAREAPYVLEKLFTRFPDTRVVEGATHCEEQEAKGFKSN